MWWPCPIPDMDGLMQDCSISIVNALEIWQSCSKPIIYLLACATLVLGPYTSCRGFSVKKMVKTDRWKIIQKLKVSESCLQQKYLSTSYGNDVYTCWVHNISIMHCMKSAQCRCTLCTYAYTGCSQQWQYVTMAVSIMAEFGHCLTAQAPVA